MHEPEAYGNWCTSQNCRNAYQDRDKVLLIDTTFGEVTDLIVRNIFNFFENFSQEVSHFGWQVMMNLCMKPQ